MTSVWGVAYVRHLMKPVAEGGWQAFINAGLSPPLAFLADPQSWDCSLARKKQGFSNLL